MKRSKTTMVQWLLRVQALIGKYSSPVRIRGKYKGHSSTDVQAWISELARECECEVKWLNRGKSYDENMAVAALLGLILSAWYSQVHRAKAMDPARPLSRKAVFKKLSKWRSDLAVVTTDERLMGRVFGRQQNWNFPLGRGAKGGKFI